MKTYKMKRGVRWAVRYLQAVYPTRFVPDDIHRYARINIKADTLAHSLRRLRKAGEVGVEYIKGVAFYYCRPAKVRK